MSTNEEKQPQIAGAICAPPPPSQNYTIELNQPRQPTSLQGVLRFCMEATKSEDAKHESNFQPLDEERKLFLKQALQSLTIDVIEELLKQISILEKLDDLKDGDDPTEYVKAFETINEFVCDIDTANDFHKINGFTILQPCLKCAHPQIRAEACNLIAELSQNNPYCQRILLENDFMPILMNLVENDPDTTVKIKAIYAISSLIRQNSIGCTQFIQYRGVQVFLETLKKNDEKCVTKICFLLTSLCEFVADFKSRLIFVGYIPVLFSLLSKEPNQSHEHVIELLMKLIEDNSAAINECRLPKNDYNIVLSNYLKTIQDKEEFATIEELCRDLNSMLSFDMNGH